MLPLDVEYGKQGMIIEASHEGEHFKSIWASEQWLNHLPVDNRNCLLGYGIHKHHCPKALVEVIKSAEASKEAGKAHFIESKILCKTGWMNWIGFGQPVFDRQYVKRWDVGGLLLPVGLGDKARGIYWHMLYEYAHTLDILHQVKEQRAADQERLREKYGQE